jgi:hypothetical protein
MCCLLRLLRLQCRRLGLLFGLRATVVATTRYGKRAKNDDKHSNRIPISSRTLKHIDRHCPASPLKLDYAPDKRRWCCHQLTTGNAGQRLRSTARKRPTSPPRSLTNLSQPI